jgi:hypothetical protein
MWFLAFLTRNYIFSPHELGISLGDLTYPREIGRTDE